jgi:hypothetical protein
MPTEVSVTSLTRLISGGFVFALCQCNPTSGNENGAPSMPGVVDGGSAMPESHDAGSDTPCEHPDYPGIRTCCGAPGERPGFNCVSWGETANVKHFVLCCRDLTYISISQPIVEPTRDSGTCTDLPPIDTDRICSRCGNGECGMGENRCNCPADCS